ncbi:Hypothetical protein D9617_23g005930 [Elsinoe fawcettii]|nr:Hypothetical protein D9617_23g005930 [Elsinoe fawcettii]
MLITIAFAAVLGLTEALALEPRGYVGGNFEYNCRKGADTVGKINAAFKDPLLACYWFSLRNDRLSPLQSVDATAMLFGCPCLLASPTDAKSTMPKPAKGLKGARKLLSDVIANPDDFCNYWVGTTDRNSSPFSTITVKTIDSACADITASVSPAVNYFQNPYFEGSGDWVSTGYLTNLVLSKWIPGGYWVTVLGPQTGDPVGNQVQLSAFYNGNSSDTEAMSSITQNVTGLYDVKPRTWRINFNFKASVIAATCRQELIVNNQMQFLRTITNNSTTPKDSSAKTKSVFTTFTLNQTGTAQITFRTRAIENDKYDGKCSMQVAKVVLYPLKDA